MSADLWARYEAVVGSDRSHLSSTERAIFAICDLRQEVSSGGFDSYFRYWGGNTAPEALAALPDVLGADWAALLADGMSGFGEPYPGDPDVRSDIIDERDLGEALGELDDRFYGLEEARDIDGLMTSYLDAATD